MIFRILIFLMPLFAISEENFQNKIQNIMTTIQQKKGGIQDSSLSNIINPFFTQTLKTSSDIKKSRCFDFDIQTATKSEFQAIQYIDRFIATKIIEYRENHLVSRPEDLIYILGFTVQKVDAIREYISKNKCKIKKKRIIQKKEVVKKYIKKFKKRYVPKLKIQIIFNSKVKISNNWYQLGEKIRSYKISQIHSDYIILKKGSTEKKLSLVRKNHSNIRFEEK